MTELAPQRARGRLAILCTADLERLDAAALDVLADDRRRDAVARGARRARRRRARRPTALACTMPPERRAPAASAWRRRASPSAPAPARRWSPASRSLLTTDGCCVEIYDLETGEKRGTTAADVAAISASSTRCREVDFCWPAVSAQDRPVERPRPARALPGVANTGKHVQTVTVVEPEPARVAVRDGARRARRRGAAARRAADQRPARHGHAARQRRGHAGGRPDLRRGRRPHRLRHHAAWAAPPRRSPWPARSSSASPRRSRAVCADPGGRSRARRSSSASSRASWTCKSGDFTGGAPEDTHHGAPPWATSATSTACRPSAASTSSGAKDAELAVGAGRHDHHLPVAGSPASTCSPASAWSPAAASSRSRS